MLKPTIAILLGASLNQLKRQRAAIELQAIGQVWPEFDTHDFFTAI